MVGIPHEDLVGTMNVIDAGAVALFYGSSVGVTPEGNRLLRAASRYPRDRFGAGLRK